jgi:hypothetical protein
MSDVMMYRCEKDKKDVKCSDVQASDVAHTITSKILFYPFKSHKS